MFSILKRFSAVLCAGMFAAVSVPPLPVDAEESMRLPIRSVAADFRPEGDDAVSITIPKKEHIDVIISRKDAEGKPQILYRSNELHAYRNQLYYLLEPGEYDLSVSMEPIKYGPVKRTYTEHIVIEEPDAGTFTHTEYRYTVTVDNVQNDDAGQPEVISDKESLSGQIKYTDSSLVFKRYDVMQGDCDGDGVITAMDAQKTLTAFANELAGETEDALTPAQTAACDIDGNDKITAVDAQWILVYYLDSIIDGEPQWPYSSYTEDVQFLYAMGTYQEEDSTVEITWIGSEWPEKVDVLRSPDGETYTAEATVTDASMYSYPVDDDFVSSYFKVAYTDDDGKTVESVPFLIDAKEDGITVNYPDSDGDGISDILESLFCTDADKDDTDGDGLTDGQEICITNTDPTKYDSVLPGVSDADVDCDGDDVVNRLEIEYGTNPQNADTDGDGLTDGEELAAHTDPLLADTDGDGLKDGFEIRYGLNPLSAETDGIADADRQIEQTIEPQDINTEESPYEMTVEVTAKGDAEQGITVSKSEYSAALENDAQIGEIIDLTVSDFLETETMRLKFAVDPDYRDNTLNKYAQYEDMQGIRRLSVFKYYDEINMMLPVETQHDLENNVIYADVSEPGTYCVIDMEVWFDLFDLEPEEIEAALADGQPDEPFTRCIQGGAASAETAYRLPKALNPVRLYVDTNPYTHRNQYPIDLVFILQTSGPEYAKDVYDYELLVLEDVVDYVFRNYSNAYVHVIRYDADRAEAVKFGNRTYCTNLTAFSNGVRRLSYTTDTEYCPTKPAFQKAAQSLELRNSVNTFFYHMHNGNNLYELDYDGIVMANSNYGIFSQVLPEGYIFSDDSYPAMLHDEIVSNHGIDITLSENSVQDIVSHIAANIDSSRMRTDYDALLGNSLKKITLKTELSSSDGTNSDTDALTDWEESNQQFIKKHQNGTTELPTLQEMIQKVDVDIDGILRSSGGGAASLAMMSAIKYRKVLPCISDPTERDTDRDGLDDSQDHLPLLPADRRFAPCSSSDYSTIPENAWVTERLKASEADYRSWFNEDDTFEHILSQIDYYGMSILGRILEVTAVFALSDARAGVVDLGLSTLCSELVSWIFAPFEKTGPLVHAPAALENYCIGAGLDYHFNDNDICELISCSSNNLEHFYYNLTKTMQYGEQIAQEGSQIYFTTVPDTDFKATCFDNKGYNCIFIDNAANKSKVVYPSNRHHSGEYSNFKHVDWQITVGESLGGIRAKITRSGDTYTMTYRYCVNDIYEWTPDQIASIDRDTFEIEYEPEKLGYLLHSLHQRGYAKEFHMSGSFEGTLTWKEGALIDDKNISDQIKSDLKNTEGSLRWNESNVFDEFYASKQRKEYRDIP